jgi:hypothetical protein
MLPESGFSAPMSMCTKVDFPTPDLPVRATNSLLWILKLRVLKECFYAIYFGDIPKADHETKNSCVV